MISDFDYCCLVSERVYHMVILMEASLNSSFSLKWISQLCLFTLSWRHHYLCSNTCSKYLTLHIPRLALKFFGIFENWFEELPFLWISPQGDLLCIPSFQRLFFSEPQLSSAPFLRDSGSVCLLPNTAFPALALLSSPLNIHSSLESVITDTRHKVSKYYCRSKEKKAPGQVDITEIFRKKISIRDISST